MLEGKKTFSSYPSPCNVKLAPDDESSLPQETRVRLNSNNKINNFMIPPKNLSDRKLFSENRNLKKKKIKGIIFRILKKSS